LLCLQQCFLGSQHRNSQIHVQAFLKSGVQSAATAPQCFPMVRSPIVSGFYSVRFYTTKFPPKPTSQENCLWKCQSKTWSFNSLSHWDTLTSEHTMLDVLSRDNTDCLQAFVIGRGTPLVRILKK
jgi:hypothetical protein